MKIAISVTFRASRFVDKLLSSITSENATFSIPMPRFVVIELVVSDLWPFEAAIAGHTDRHDKYHNPAHARGLTTDPPKINFNTRYAVYHAVVYREEGEEFTFPVQFTTQTELAAVSYCWCLDDKNFNNHTNLGIIITA